MKTHWSAMLAILGALLVTSPQARSQIDIRKSVTAAGAVQGTDGTHRVNGTFGQSLIGNLHGNVHIAQGFWNALSRLSSGVEEPTSGGSLLTLHASPNPFSESTELRLSIPPAANATLVLYDLLGQPVRTLLKNERHEGTLTLRLNADDLRAGSYTAMLTTGSERRTVILTIVK